MDKKPKDNLEKLCRFCELAHILQDDDTMLCDRKGIVSAGFHCRKFRYDPLKRVPGKARTVPALEFVSLEEQTEQEK